MVFVTSKKKKKLNSGFAKPTESVEEKKERQEIVMKKFEQRKATKGSQSAGKASEKKKLKLMKKQQEIHRRNALMNGILKKEPKVEKIKADPDKNTVETPTSTKKEFNKQEKLFFSKIEIDGEKKKKNADPNPRENLKKLKQQKKKIKDLMEAGDKEKAMKEKQKQLWDVAFKKTDGIKVKDNEEILKKTIKKRKVEKKKSKIDWKKRAEKVKEDQDKRQKKRQDNIEKKKTEKQKQKRKLLVKKGRVF